MTFNPAKWFPIAVVLSVVNLAAVWFAARPGEPLHATTHAVLAVAFALWAYRLRQGLGGGELRARLEALEAEAGTLEALEGEMDVLRQELSEAYERLDFAERILKQAPEARRVDPEPRSPPGQS